MSKTILYIPMSLDGFIAGPNEDLSWLDTYNESDDSKVTKKVDGDNPYDFKKFQASVGAIIMGRNTYDLEKRNGWENTNPFPKFVLSKKPADPSAAKDVVFTDEDVAEVLKKAKRITDKTIWVEGGANVAQQFIERDLLDEAILFIAPMLLGGGVSLFGKLDAYKNWKLRRVREYGNGMVQLEYTIKSDLKGVQP